MAIDPIEGIIREAGNGRKFILVDDYCGREGDLVIPAQMATLGATGACPRREDRGAARLHEMRDCGLGAQIPAEVGIEEMELSTNSHRSPVALGGYGLSIVGQRPIPQSDPAR